MHQLIETIEYVLGTIFGILAELINGLKKPFAVLRGIIIELGNLAQKGLGMILGAAIEGVILIQKGLGLVVGVLAAIGNIARKGLGVSLGILVYPFRKILGVTFGLIAELWNTSKKSIAVVRGLLAEGWNLAHKVLAIVVSLGWLLFRQSIAISFGLVAVGWNLLKRSIAVTLGLLAEGWNLARKILGVGFGIGWYLFRQSLAITLSLGMGALRVLGKGLGWSLGILAEGFMGLRKISAVAIGGFFAGLYGILGGGWLGCKKLYPIIRNTISTDKTWGDTFSLVNKFFSGRKSILRSIADVYKGAAGEINPLESFQSTYHAIAGETALFTSYLPVYRSAILGQKSVPDSFISTYQVLSGNKNVITSFRETYNAIAGKTKPFHAYLPTYQHAIRGQKSQGEAFRETFQYIGGQDSFTASFQSTYRSITGEISIKDSFQFWRDTVAGPRKIGFSFKPVYLAVTQNTAPFGTLFLETYHRSNRKNMGSSFAWTFNAIGGHIRIGERFQIINRSRLFGHVPWIKQQVAKKMFEQFSGYRLSAGLATIPARCKDDFQTIKQYTDTACAGSGGLFLGLAMATPLTMAYALGGLGYGFKNSGIPGTIIGLFNGLYKGLTFAFRNTHRNLTQGRSSEQFAMKDLIKIDWKQLRKSELVVWEVFVPEASPQQETPPQADVTAHSYPIVVAALQQGPTTPSAAAVIPGSTRKETRTPLASTVAYSSPLYHTNTLNCAQTQPTQTCYRP